MNKSSSILVAFTLSLLSLAWGKEMRRMDVTLLRDSVVESQAFNMPDGPFGTCINGQTFQQEALVSSRGYQYASYFRDGGVLCLARRALPAGEWRGLRFTDYSIHHNDVHNVAVVGVCPTDGSIHLSYDHHCHPLHYRHSGPGLALKPTEVPWSTDQFCATTAELVKGKPLSVVTYPQFFPTPDGKLQLLYRLGSSGDGDWYLAEYEPETQEWTVLGMLFSRQGQYETSASRCAYPNPVRYGPKGRLHVTWCWRERPSNGVRDLRTNHDVCYAYSEDLGRTWKNNAGEVIAVLSGRQEGVPTSISVGTPGTVVQTTRYLWGQMNTTTEYVDARGRVHVINWQQQQDAIAASTDMNTWRYYHYWGSADGEWQGRQMPFHGRKPQIVLDDSGTAYVVYGDGENLNYHGQDHGWRLTIAVASEASGWTDWQTAWVSDKPFVGEPLLDPNRWADEKVLSVYCQEKPEKAGAPSPLRVLDFSVPK